MGGTPGPGPFASGGGGFGSGGGGGGGGGYGQHFGGPPSTYALPSGLAGSGGGSAPYPSLNTHFGPAPSSHSAGPFDSRAAEAAFQSAGNGPASAGPGNNFYFAERERPVLFPSPRASEACRCREAMRARTEVLLRRASPRRKSLKADPVSLSQKYTYLLSQASPRHGPNLGATIFHDGFGMRTWRRHSNPMSESFWT